MPWCRNAWSSGCVQNAKARPGRPSLSFTARWAKLRHSMAITAPCNREHQAGLSRHGMGQKHLLLLVTKTSCIFQASDIKDNPAGAIPITSQPNSQRHPIPYAVQHWIVLYYILPSLLLPIAINRQNHVVRIVFTLLLDRFKDYWLLRTFLSATGLLLLGCVHHGLQEHCPSVAVGSYQDHLQRQAGCHNT